MENHCEGIKPVSVKEALRVLPVSRESLYRMLKQGRLPHYRFGRKILVDVQECLAAMRQGGEK